MGSLNLLSGVLSPQPSRLAVDPRSLAASCLLRAAQHVTKSAPQQAKRLYRSVFITFPGTDDEYYRRQASAGLAELLIAEQDSIRTSQ